ncbi:MAG: hypothetical protein OEU09_24490, partial [Rhodospirillales bacterium]|nr:hypothetical protein [Rhodospirillales bacterium]
YTRVATGMISAVDSPLDDLGTRRRKRRKAGGRAPAPAGYPRKSQIYCLNRRATKCTGLRSDHISQIHSHRNQLIEMPLSLSPRNRPPPAPKDRGRVQSAADRTHGMLTTKIGEARALPIA